MLIRYWRPLVALVLVGILTLMVGLNRYYAGYAAAEKSWQKSWAERDARDALELEKAQREARTEERRRQETIDALTEKTQKQLALVEADADTARAAADRLHREARRYADRLAVCETRRDTDAPDERQTATASAGVLAELLRRADDRAGKLAEIADAARERGRACESAYDALSAKP